ncbi:MAG: AzlC family ABC transporter permease [Actinomycetota bacterium]|nr:AzlC family ABC transporter permease [Actinomycetota bacterium]
MSPTSAPPRSLPARRLLPQMDHAAYQEGLRAMAPLAVAIGVWGLVTGVAMVNAGLTIPIALLMTFTVFAGSAQLAVLPLLATGTPLAVVWVTALLVNLRFVIFAAAGRRSFVHLPWQQRLVAGYLNGDLGFALFSRRFTEATDHGTPEQYGYFYGTAVVNWVSWQVASVAGILMGGLLPTEWGFVLAAYLALAAVLIPMVREVPALVGVAVTAALAVATVRWPMRLGLLVAVVAGVAVALAVEAVQGSVVARRAMPDSVLPQQGDA